MADWLYNNRLTQQYYLHNDIITKNLIRSIKIIMSHNLFIKYKKHKIDFDKIKNVKDETYIYLHVSDDILYINFNHYYCDGYSLFYIAEKISKVYYNENVDCKIKTSYKSYDLVKSCKNTLDLMSNATLRDMSCYLYDIIYPSTRNKTYYIKKTLIQNYSNSEIIKYICKKLKINEFCLIVNLRKLFPEYNDCLDNMIYVTDNININESIKDVISRDKNKSIKELKNKLHKRSTIINSFLGFKKPKILKGHDVTTSNYIGNSITIYSKECNKDYIVFKYISK